MKSKLSHATYWLKCETDNICVIVSQIILYRGLHICLI